MGCRKRPPPFEAERPWTTAGITPAVFGALAASAGAGPSMPCCTTCTRRRWASIGAGVQAVPIGHTHGQQILARLHDELCARGRGTGRPPSEDSAAASAPPMRCYAMHKAACIRDFFDPEERPDPFAARATTTTPSMGGAGPYSGPRGTSSRSASAARSARARPRSSSACAANFWPADQPCRHHQRHLHARGRRVPGPPRGVAAGAHRRRRDRRLSAQRHPRGRQHQPRRHRRRWRRRFPGLATVVIESGGDNLAATFSPELADRTIYVIDVAEGDKIPRKGGPGITRSDLLVINKIDLAPHVGADLEVMRRDSLRHARRPALSSCQPAHGDGVPELLQWVGQQLASARPTS